VSIVTHVGINALIMGDALLQMFAVRTGMAVPFSKRPFWMPILNSILFLSRQWMSFILPQIND
jgi:hypothetical protein